MEYEQMSKVWFTADTHFMHKNILKHCPARSEHGGFEVDDVDAHDRWVIDAWNRKVAKKDTVYIVGDFAFGSADKVKKFIGKLNGNKFLVLGNHDGSSDHLVGYFKQIVQLKDIVFKKKNYDFLEEDFHVFLCHYPMVTWPAKHYGSVNVHGHCHGRLDKYNEESTDLRVDVGIDGKLSGFEPVGLPELYAYFKEKASGMMFREYAEKMREQNMII